MQHDDDDHDCDIEIHLNPFLLITVSDAFIRRMAGIADEQLAEAFAAGAVELESEPGDDEIVAMHRADVPDLTWTPLFAHPPFDKPRSRLSPRAIDRLLGLEKPPSVGRPVVEAALALPDITTTLGVHRAPVEIDGEALHPLAHLFGGLGYKGMIGKLNDEISAGFIGQPPRERTFVPTYPIVKLENIGPDGDTAYLVSPEGIAFAGTEANARTWGDHGELFELPSGWRFQDNMIQGAAGEPCDNLFVVITYDADNLPNPWEWQLHEATSSDSDALWEEVPTSTDKPRAGWARTLLAARPRAGTPGSSPLGARRAAAGGA